MAEPLKFLVAGEWRASGKKRPVVNPFEGRTVGEVFQASPADIDDSIAAADSAFERTRKLSSFERSAILAEISGEVQRRKEEFAQLITSETGKPILFSRLEVDRCIFTFQVASEEAKRIEGSILPLDLVANAGNRTALVRRFPLGPVSAITPFNFPLNLVAHKLGPAIAAGNSVVLKPSSNAPMVSLKLAEIIERTTYPKSGINVVPCASGEANQLITDERLKLVTFTGSPGVGWGLKAKAGKKRVVLELGGNAGVIVDRSANLEYALQKLVVASYGNAGQSCIAVQRIFVHRDVVEPFLERFLKMTKGVAVGDPSDERTIVGPMITEDAARKVEGWIKEAVNAGAKVLCGGARRGAMLQPTILVDVKPDMNVCCQEVFAPVVTVEQFSEFSDAVHRVNLSSYGLQAGVFTNDLKNVFLAYQELEVGGVIVNDSSAYRLDHMPYGGVKDSGFGREGLRYAIEEMTEMKLLGLNII
jgi:glyceraldehyde-3-phosphate dehydrogenase (NADP+)